MSFHSIRLAQLLSHVQNWQPLFMASSIGAEQLPNHVQNRQPQFRVEMKVADFVHGRLPETSMAGCQFCTWLHKRILFDFRVQPMAWALSPSWVVFIGVAQLSTHVRFRQPQLPIEIRVAGFVHSRLPKTYMDGCRFCTWVVAGNIHGRLPVLYISIYEVNYMLLTTTTTTTTGSVWRRAWNQLNVVVVVDYQNAFINKKKLFDHPLVRKFLFGNHCIFVCKLKNFVCPLVKIFQLGNSIHSAINNEAQSSIPYSLRSGAIANLRQCGATVFLIFHFTPSGVLSDGQ